MRRSCFAILLMITAVTTGCRQTTSQSATNPLTPIGPLAPVSGASATSGGGSVFGPLGAPTRVTPPDSGTFSVPNNYMGGVLPINQAAAGNPSPGGFASSTPGLYNQVIGSGVQSAGWTETNSNVQTAGGAFAPLGETGPPASSLGPRLGGMRVIDMTGAPPPPGYRGPAPILSAPLQPIAPAANFDSNFQPLNQPFNPIPGFRTIQSPSPGDIAGPQNNLPPNTWQSPVTIAQTPWAGLSPAAPSQDFQGSSQFQPGPSTDPVANGSFGNQPNSDLQWRAPASRY